MKLKFLVTGATGLQGGSTVRLLLHENVTVHALVRNPSAPAAQMLKEAGAVLFKGDFDNIPAINEAMADVNGVFLNTFPTPDPNTQLEQVRSFIKAARDSKTVKSIVLSTAFWTSRREIWATGDHNDFLYSYYSSNAAIEDAVRSAGLQSYTILRPSVLMHNYLLPASIHHYPDLSTSATLSHIYNLSTRMPHFAAADVGKVAAKALLEPEKFNGHEIELGFENLTIEEIAAALSTASGREIKIRLRTLEEAAEVENLVVTQKFQRLANEYRLDIDGKALEEKYGVKLTTFKEFLDGEREMLMKSLPP